MGIPFLTVMGIPFLTVMGIPFLNYKIKVHIK